MPKNIKQKKLPFKGTAFANIRKITQTKNVCYIVANILEGWQSIRVNS